MSSASHLTDIWRGEQYLGWACARGLALAHGIDRTTRDRRRGQLLLQLRFALNAEGLQRTAGAFLPDTLAKVAAHKVAVRYWSFFLDDPPEPLFPVSDPFPWCGAVEG